jgi:hypothetical protein
MIMINLLIFRHEDRVLHAHTPYSWKLGSRHTHLSKTKGKMSNKPVNSMAMPIGRINLPF